MPRPTHSNHLSLARASWRKSSRSGSNGGDCLEAAHLGFAITIRDSKLNTTGDFPVLTIPTADWNSLLSAVSA